MMKVEVGEDSITLFTVAECIAVATKNVLHGWQVEYYANLGKYYKGFKIKSLYDKALVESCETFDIAKQIGGDTSLGSISKLGLSSRQLKEIEFGSARFNSVAELVYAWRCYKVIFDIPIFVDVLEAFKDGDETMPSDERRLAGELYNALSGNYGV